ncbi:MAG: hypothetical protein ACLRJV_16595 [Eubacteriales bacterium]
MGPISVVCLLLSPEQQTAELLRAGSQRVERTYCPVEEQQGESNGNKDNINVDSLTMRKDPSGSFRVGQKPGRLFLQSAGRAMEDSFMIIYHDTSYETIQRKVDRQSMRWRTSILCTWFLYTEAQQEEKQNSSCGRN